MLCVRVIVGVVALGGLALVGSACKPLRERQYEEFDQQRCAEAEMFVSDVRRAQGACIYVASGVGRRVEQSFPLNAAEFARLKDILVQTRHVPSSHYMAAPPSTEIKLAYFQKVQLLGEDGGLLRSVPLEFQWMAESELPRLNPNRMRSMYDAPWYLPDAALDALYSLPSLLKAQRWIQLATGNRR